MLDLFYRVIAHLDRDFFDHPETWPAQIIENRDAGKKPMGRSRKQAQHLLCVTDSSRFADLGTVYENHSVAANYHGSRMVASNR